MSNRDVRTSVLAAALAAASPCWGASLNSLRVVEVPGQVPGMADYYSVQPQDAWLTTFLGIAQMADRLPSMAGLDGLSAAIPYLDPSNDLYNPRVAGSLREELRSYEDDISRDVLDGLVRRAGGSGSVLPNAVELEHLKRFIDVRYKASVRAAMQTGEAASGDLKGKEDELKKALDDIDRSGLYDLQRDVIQRNGRIALEAAGLDPNVLGWGSRAVQENAAGIPEAPPAGQRAASALRRPAARNGAAKNSPTLVVDQASIEAREQARKAGRMGKSTLITGETGTGKELMAREVHLHSDRRHNNFVAVNVAAMPERLFEDTLQGHKKGAFTGADQNKDGLMKVADGGTLFLDEIGEMPLNLQIKLLNALKNGFYRVGDAGGQLIKVNVRVVAATHRDLEAMVAAGAFSRELLDEIGIIRIKVAPLRDRPKDIPELAQFFLDVAERGGGGTAAKELRISPAAMKILLAYRWPGNVRELQHAMVTAAILTKDEVRPEHLPEELLRGGADVEDTPPSGGPDRAAFERAWLVRAIWQSPTMESLGKALGVAVEAAERLLSSRDLLGVWRLAREAQAETYNWAKYLIAESAAMRQVLYRVDRVAPTSVNVLITGLGKARKLVAEAIHRASRRPEPILIVNLAAILPDLLESELFGHEKGAFTGATERHIGLLERAGQGTIVLEGLEDLPLELQPKLLRVLQERTFSRLGNTTEVLNFNARVVAATDKDLGRLVAEGRFREDLYHRLRVFPIELPPLSKRPEDVIPLTRVLLEKIRIEQGLGRAPEADEEVARAVARHTWQNAAALEKALNQAVFKAYPRSRLTIGDLDPEVAASRDARDPAALTMEAMAAAFAALTPVDPGMVEPTLSLEKEIEPQVKDYFLEALTLHQGILTQMEKPAGINRSTIRSWLKRLDLSAKSSRKAAPLRWRAGNLPKFDEYKKKLENAYILRVVAYYERYRGGEGNQTRMAKLLGISRGILRNRLRELGLLSSTEAEEPDDETPAAGEGQALPAPPDSP